MEKECICHLFSLKLNNTKSETDGVISLIISGGMTRNVVFSFIAEEVKEIKEASLLISSAERTVNTASSHVKALIISAEFCNTETLNLLPREYLDVPKWQ
jgi:uncharacterized radical SAM superfamily protein